MKKGIFIFIIAFASQLHGYQNVDNSTSIFADLLVWELREGSADNWAQVISSAGANQSVNILEVPFDFTPGLRLGVGRNSFDDSWDSVFYYTWYQTKGTSQASVEAGGIYSPFLGNFFINNTNGANFEPKYRNASILWKLYYNTVDLELGRKFQINSLLNLRPFIGLKLAVINQRINSNWQNPTIATTFSIASENIKNDFWGIGPVIGLNTSWNIFKSYKHAINISGNFSGALVAGHWSFNDQYENNTPTSVTVHNDSINGASTMARAFFGLEWNTFFNHSDIVVHLGYEAQVWFNQLQYYSFNMGRLDNIMSLQGGTFDLCFNF